MEYKPTPNQHFYAGTIAGVLSSGIYCFWLLLFVMYSPAILYPLDLVKVRYQVYDKSGRAYRSIISAFSTIVKTEGIHGLYQV